MCEILAHDILDESIVLNDDDDESESTQSKADNSDQDIDSTDKFDDSFHDSISELIDNDFNSIILIFNYMTAYNFNADECNENNCITIKKCSLLTEQQKSVSSCCDFIFDCDDFNKSEDDYVFDVFTTDDDENDVNSWFRKWQKLFAIFCRYSSLKTIISELQDDRSIQTQSSSIAAVTVLQSDLKSDYDCHQEDVVESDSNNHLRFHIIEFINIISSVTILCQCSNVKNS